MILFNNVCRGPHRAENVTQSEPALYVGMRTKLSSVHATKRKKRKIKALDPNVWILAVQIEGKLPILLFPKLPAERVIVIALLKTAARCLLVQKEISSWWKFLKLKWG